MTVKEAAKAIGVSTKTLSNRLMRKGVPAYGARQRPSHEEFKSVLKEEELEPFLVYWKTGTVQESVPDKPASVPAPPPPVQEDELMKAVAEIIGRTKNELGQEVQTMKRYLAESLGGLEANTAKLVGSEVEQYTAKALKETNEAWEEKLAGLHQAATKALDVAENPPLNERDLVGIVFGGQAAVLCGAAALMAFGAFAYQSIARDLVQSDSTGTMAFAFFAGLVVHFAGLLNAYRKSQAKVPAYQTHPVVYWIAAFAFFECLLHGCNFQAFGSGTVYVAKFVMTISVPLATAALADAMLITQPSK